MDENNIIICSNCYEENVVGAKTCRKCGAKIYYNDEKMLKEITEDEEDEAEKNTFNKEEKSEAQYIDSSNSSNIVANKFRLVVRIIKIIGYAGAVIIAIMMMSTDYFGFLAGLLTGIGISITTWFSTLLFEAIAEGLNLLQDIKNKL